MRKYVVYGINSCLASRFHINVCEFIEMFCVGMEFDHIVKTRAKNGKVKHYLVNVGKPQLQQEDNKFKEAPSVGM